MARPTVEDDKAAFLKTLDERGGNAGNKTLRETLAWEDARYWRTHTILIDEGLILRGRGKGGSVSRVPLVEENSPASDTESPHPVSTFPTEPTEPTEYDLYEPALQTISNGWVKERGYDEAASEITALPGRRRTRGTWTRPDISVLAVKAYPYLPGRHFEIVTFEIKKHDSVDVTGVFEALSHRQFAMFAYVVFCTNGAVFHETYRDADRLLTLAENHGVGVFVATDVKNYDCWNELVEPRRNTPDPEQANLFIGNCFSEDNKARVVKWQK